MNIMNTENLRKAAQAVFLATEEVIAHDLANKLRFAADEIDSLRNAVKMMKKEIATLREQKFVRFNDEECWIYQGDGSDHLESLVCPVVISAGKLLELSTKSGLLWPDEEEFDYIP